MNRYMNKYLKISIEIEIDSIIFSFRKLTKDQK